MPAPAPTFTDYYNAAKAELVSIRPELTVLEGDVSDMILAGAAASADVLTGYIAQRIKGVFLDMAEGDDLTTLVYDRYRITRFAATPATGAVQVSRTNANGAPSGTIPAGTVFSTQPDVQGNVYQFSTDLDDPWAAGDLGPHTVNVTALQSGPASNVQPGTVVQIVGSLFDPTFAVVNDTTFAGGADQETDDALRNRARNQAVTIQRGTDAAIVYGALQVAGVATASVAETNGIVNVYVADASGNSSPTMITNVKAIIDNYRSGGTVVNVFGGALLSQDISVVVTARLGVNTQTLVANIQAAITARVNQLQIGDTLDPAMISQAVYNVDPRITKVQVLTPAVAVEPLPNQIIRAGAVTVS